MTRSWLFVPGHAEALLAKVFDAGADAVVLDLEDAVPRADKERARALVRRTLEQHRAWVRINPPGTAEAESDIEAVAAGAAGLRLPKVESPEQVDWVRERAPGLPLGCTIESAPGVLAAVEIARAAGVAHLVFGAADLASDLRVAVATEPLLHARSHVVLASRAAGIAGPVDGAYVGPDGAGLREAAVHARSLGFSGKSAIRPVQITVINEVFSPDARDLAWALEVVTAFDSAGGAATRLADGRFVDTAIVRRARELLAGNGL